MESRSTANRSKSLKFNIVAVLALAVVLAGCSEEKPYTPPKGLASSGAASTDDLTSGASKDATKSADDKKEKALDLGHTSAGDSETSPIPDMPTSHQPDSTPNVEFEKDGKKAEPTPPPTPAPSPVNVQPAMAAPEKIAIAADKAMLGLKDTLANIPVLATYGDLKGRIFCQLKLRDSGTYWVQYAQYENGEAHAAMEVSDGVKRIHVNGTNGKKKTIPTSQAGEVPTLELLPDAWMVDMPKIVLSPWIERKPIFESLVKSFRQAGYEVKADSLKMVKPEHTFIQDRLTFTRPASQVATKGKAMTVLIFDHDHGLPVTIEIQSEPLKQRPVKMLWRAAWLFGKKFPDTTFAANAGPTS